MRFTYVQHQPLRQSQTTTSGTTCPTLFDKGVGSFGPLIVWEWPLARDLPLEKRVAPRVGEGRSPKGRGYCICTYLASCIPRLLRIVVTGVHSPTGRVDSAQLPFVVFYILCTLCARQVHHFRFLKGRHLVKFVYLKSKGKVSDFSN